MTNSPFKKKDPAVKEVNKPFLTGRMLDQRTIRNSLVFFGTLIVVIFITFIATATGAIGGDILRIILNSAVIVLALYIFYNSGTKRGTDDVARGEILWQKHEKQESFPDSEKKLCFHPMKGYITGLIGTLPFLALTVFLAVNATIQMTEAGTLPSWMESYTRRSDIGSALISYTQPTGMTAVEFVRAMVRITILPYVNLVTSANKAGILLLERLSPLIILLPAAAYGTGYLTGKNVRTQIHTAISANEQKRIRKETKRRAARNRQGNRRGPEQLN